MTEKDYPSISGFFVFASKMHMYLCGLTFSSLHATQVLNIFIFDKSIYLQKFQTAVGNYQHCAEGEQVIK